MRSNAATATAGRLLWEQQERLIGSRLHGREVPPSGKSPYRCTNSAILGRSSGRGASTSNEARPLRDAASMAGPGPRLTRCVTSATTSAGTTRSSSNRPRDLDATFAVTVVGVDGRVLRPGVNDRDHVSIRPRGSRRRLAPWGGGHCAPTQRSAPRSAQVQVCHVGAAPIGMQPQHGSAIRRRGRHADTAIIDGCTHVCRTGDPRTSAAGPSPSA